VGSSLFLASKSNESDAVQQLSNRGSYRVLAIVSTTNYGDILRQIAQIQSDGVQVSKSLSRSICDDKFNPRHRLAESAYDL